MGTSQGRSARSARHPRLMPALLAALFALSAAQEAIAQRQVTTTVPFRSVSDSFFERNGVSTNFRGPGFNVNLGSFPLAVPPFGGFQPGAGVAGGFGFQGGSFSGNVAFEFSQGSRRSNVMQAGSLTMMDGVPGILADVTLSPFVISTQPVVPLRPGIPWKQQLDMGAIPRRTTQDHDAPPRDASAGKPPAHPGDAVVRQAADQGHRPIRSVAEIRRQRQAASDAKNDEALEHFRRGEQAARDGKPGVAKIHYQMAVRQASGELKQKIEEKLTELSKP